MPRISSQTAEFERSILPHLASAYNVAQWLLGVSSHDSAEDVVQDSCIRAFQHFGGFRGGDSRAWFLAIVRNCAFTAMRRSKSRGPEISLDELFDDANHSYAGPENDLLASVDIAIVRSAIEKLPVEFREVVVLKDMEDLSYREIAAIAGIPVGTVMSRLNRARKRLRTMLSATQAQVEANDEL